VTAKLDPALCARLVSGAKKHDEAMTTGTAVAGLYRSDELDDQLIQFREAHAEFSGQPMHVVAVAASDKPIELDATCFATTGNGPHGGADARGIAWMRNNLRDLADQLEAALAEVRGIDAIRALALAGSHPPVSGALSEFVQWLDDNLAIRNNRVSALEAGLREACDQIDCPEVADRLRALANNQPAGT